MKLTVSQKDLLPSLQSVSRSIAVRPSLPVLNNILIQTEEGQLKLSATNLEMGVIKRINCKVIEEGEITIPAKTFLEVVSALSDKDIEVETAGENLKITSGSFSANLNGIAASEFPSIPLSSEKSTKFDPEILKTSVPQISFAAAADEGRPILTGILTEIKSTGLELVATDGFRLARKIISLKSETTLKVLIPRRTFEEVVRLIAEDETEEGSLEISTSENQNQIIFKIGQTELSSRLIEGNFPSWEKIIPTKIENTTILDREELLKAVKLASVFARSEANVIKLQTGEGELKLFSEAKELGGQQNGLPAKVEGSEIQIAFNSRYLVEALSACSSNQISIEFSGNLSPAILRPIGEEGLEYVIMPIRLS